MREANIKKMLFITCSIFSVLLIAFIITSFMYNKQEETQLSKFDANVVKEYNSEKVSENAEQEMIKEEPIKEEEQKKVAVNTSEIEEKVQEERKEEAKQQAEVNKPEETVETNTKPEESQATTPKFIKPVEGEIIQEFAKSNLVYSSTLGEWITHYGIDIKADKTTVVKASSKGIVKYIKNDPRYGLTIVIEHTGGYKTVYANLLSTEFVVVGEEVIEGQTIGTVGTTSTFEVLDDPHLHFEILKDDEYLDPQLMLN